jgi:hypothetical protein
LSEADPFTDQPFCCDDGTSQASAFTAAVLVALMSYDPKLSYAKAEQLLIQTATGGDLNVAAAFNADGLSQIVNAGNAAIPVATPAPGGGSLNQAHPGAAKSPAYPVHVRSVHWRKGTLTIALTGMKKGETVHVRLRYTHRRARLYSSHRAKVKIRTGKPVSVIVHVMRGKRAVSALTALRP